ncbi:hypothetical protein OL229_19180 [Neisseriaceae bacterium JH1-16]|nr:hypothetical protein [Neisseriaceae bacterium JH1-16]
MNNKLSSSSIRFHRLATSAILLSLALAGQASFAASASTQQALEYQQYLKDNYDVALTPDPTNGEYLKTLGRVLKLAPAEQTLLGSDQLKPNQPLTELNATLIAVKAAGLKELAYTYPDAKVKRALKKLGITDTGAVGLDAKGAQELAAAVDTGLIPAESADSFKPAGTAKWDFEYQLLGKVLAANGLYKHYLGNTRDDDILSKVSQAWQTHWQTQGVIPAPELRAVFDEALKQNLVTGYNLKDKRYTAQFDRNLSLTYGHSDIRHARQLIGLLRSEGIAAKVQLEPKTSAFIYLKEWGEPKTSDDYQVVQIPNGNFIAYAKEYDLAFEFDNTADKDRFQKIVFSYAKKNTDNQPGLLYDSWWQPLYYSLTAISDYKLIADHKIDQGNYYAQSFSLADKSASVAAGLKKLKPGVAVDSYTVWVDEPFFNYLNGGSK